jgi:hypothetical protein
MKRRYTIDTLAAEANRGGFGFAAKNHFQSTTAGAARLAPNSTVPIIGSITLNRGVGGISWEAVRAALSGYKADPTLEEREQTPIIVWMPTIHAEGHLTKHDRKDMLPGLGSSKIHNVYPEGSGLTVWESGRRGVLSEQTLQLLDYIASEDLVLATGHLTADEVEAVVSHAARRGIRRIIVTHPDFKATDMPISTQADLANRDGVYVELTYLNLVTEGTPVHVYVEAIRTLGAENVILTTDFGRLAMPTVSEGWEGYFKLLSEAGITETEFVQMAVLNPHTLASGASKG